MLEIIASSQELRKKRRKEINDGDVVCIGREPKHGWSIPWDTLISREHVQLAVKNGKANVQRLPSGRNEVHYKGKTPKSFTMLAGEKFQIGKTTFELIDANAATGGFGSQFGQFRISKVLGDGLLGPLLGATDQKIKQSVALRVFDTSLTSDSATLERIVQSTYELEKNRPGGIATVFESGREGDRHYSSREFVQGNSLERTLQKQPKIPPQRSLELVEGIARALGELCKLGLWHGNLKPSNIISRLGGVRLVDLSLGCPVAVRLLRGGFSEGGEQLTDYLAPELLDAPLEADIRSDLYALGCLWFRMLTGGVLYPDGPHVVRMKSHAPLTPQWQRIVSLGIDSAKIEVLRTLLSRSPSDRFQTPEMLLEALTSREVRGGQVECPGCGKTYRIKSELAGKRVTCKVCGAKIQVPHEL